MWNRFNEKECEKYLEKDQSNEKNVDNIWTKKPCIGKEGGQTPIKNGSRWIKFLKKGWNPPPSWGGA